MSALLLLIAPNEAAASPCDEWALFVPGTTIVMSSFDKKGKLTGTVTTKNQGVTGGVAQIHAETTDEKGKHLATADYTVSCNNGSVAIDMPAGQALPDSTIRVTLSPPAEAATPTPFPLITLDMTIRNRQVGASTEITTPAGTYTAWPISSESEVVTTTLVPVRLNVTSVDYYTPSVGVVKSVTSRNGKLMGTTELTSISR